MQRQKCRPILEI